MDEDFSFLQPLDLITKDVHELRQIIRDKRRNLQRDREKDRDKEPDREIEGDRGRVREKEKHEKEKDRENREKEREKVKKEKEKEREKQSEDHADREMVMDQEEKDTVKNEENVLPGGKLFWILYIFCMHTHTHIYSLLFICTRLES